MAPGVYLYRGIYLYKGIYLLQGISFCRGKSPLSGIFPSAGKFPFCKEYVPQQGISLCKDNHPSAEAPSLAARSARPVGEPLLIHKYVCMYIIHTRMYICMYVCIYIYIYIYNVITYHSTYYKLTILIICYVMSCHVIN